MRKRSHISLARFIVENMEESWLCYHRKAFYLGSILPDCRPSFLTKRHEFYATFDDVAQAIRDLAQECALPAQESVSYWRRLGEVTHYVADYFTFPHDSAYTGTLREHCAYERELRDYLKEYIASGKAALLDVGQQLFESVEALLDFVRSAHEEYQNLPHTVEGDVNYIVRLCQQVLAGIVQLRAADQEMQF